MDRATFWATVAQVVPVLLLVYAVELGIVSRFLWSQTNVLWRTYNSAIVIGLGYVEAKALFILAGRSEFFFDEGVAIGAISNAIGTILGIALAAIWVRR